MIESLIPVSSADDVRAVAVELDRLVRADGAGEVGAGHRRLGGDPSSRASASATAAAKIPPRIAPRSRMWRTRVRVSTPVIAGTPQASSQSSQPPSASAASSPFLASRMITARAWTRSDSIAGAPTP